MTTDKHIAHDIIDDDHIAMVQDELQRVRTALSTVIVGHEQLIDDMLIAIACGGHVLLEGLPGLGKTLLVRTLGRVLNLSFSRLQFTPDLMPADILGGNILVADDRGGRHFRFEPGPIFSQIVLADEINRATPKTQSALLEAMQEHRVTLAGQSHALPRPFFVLATQNPIEMEGTYPLPEAQIDRFFFKLQVGRPSVDSLRLIVERTTGTPPAEPDPIMNADTLMELQQLVRTVPVASHVQQYALDIIMATHPDESAAPPLVQRYVRFGASPRGAQALLLAAKARALFAGRFNVAFRDIEAVVYQALQHRLILTFEATVDDISPVTILQAIVSDLDQSK